MTLPQATAECGLAISSLRQAILRGRLQAEKVGRDWIITDVALQRYLASRRPGNFTKGANRTPGSIHRKRDTDTRLVVLDEAANVPPAAWERTHVGRANVLVLPGPDDVA